MDKWMKMTPQQRAAFMSANYYTFTFNDTTLEDGFAKRVFEMIISKSPRLLAKLQ